ncbi:hypothetical protein GBAR_LOCUS5335 [Geodia barretti]|uniref:Uncharacterized protein n=1 Tax=Geodia barretti TaxID=519541 RepID=A0AA35W508_GEOBA|nr:hypothetical protein GBAR_LOCUS5335 [Geodia barretti]
MVLLLFVCNVKVNVLQSKITLGVIARETRCDMGVQYAILLHRLNGMVTNNNPSPLSSPLCLRLNRNPPAHMGISRLSEMAPPPISPPSTVTPPLCRSTPSTTVTFKFETASGSSCSNLDSDISDVHSPSYSYRVTPPPPPSTCPSTIQSQQSYHSLGRSSHTHQSLHSTRDSLSSYPPAPAHCATNV